MTTEPTSSEPAGATTAHPGGPLAGGLGVAVFVVLFGAAGFLTYRTLYTAPIPEAQPIPIIFMCKETGKTFEYGMKIGEEWPVESPYTHQKSGYPAEACYWTRDGKRKRTPTWVILNEKVGKKEDTICPDCGRLVVGHNPLPGANVPFADAPATAPAGASPTANK